MDQFLKDIGMWLNFKERDVTKDTLREIANHSHDLPDYKNNPKIAEIKDIYAMLENGYSRK